MNEEPPFKPSDGAKPTGRPSRTLPNPLRLERKRRAYGLKLRGFSYRQIGAELGIDVKDAHTLVKEELFDTTDVLREQVREHRQLELDRLESVISRLWVAAFPVDEDGKAGEVDHEAVRSLLRAMERKQKLLGLEAPQKHQVDVSHLQSQVGLVVEMIARVIPDDSVPKVYEAMEQAMKVIDSRERSLGSEEVA